MDEAVATLFQAEKELQSPELSLHRVLAEARDNVPAMLRWRVEEELLNGIRDLVGQLFMFDEQHRLSLTGSGLMVEGPEGRFPITAHGDGYQNTAAWVLDLLGRYILRRGNTRLTRISGIVLIDEIDQHLHPRWQRKIIQKLVQLFPDIQFLFTTHSPLCALGASSLGSGKSQVYKVDRDAEGSSSLQPLPSLRGLRADQVLTDAAFNLSSSRDPETEAQLELMAELFLKTGRSDEEERQLNALQLQLKDLPGEGEHQSTRILEAELRQKIKRLDDLLEES